MATCARATTHDGFDDVEPHLANGAWVAWASTGVTWRPLLAVADATPRGQPEVVSHPPPATTASPRTRRTASARLPLDAAGGTATCGCGPRPVARARPGDAAPGVASESDWLTSGKGCCSRCRGGRVHTWSSAVTPDHSPRSRGRTARLPALPDIADRARPLSYQRRAVAGPRAERGVFDPGFASVAAWAGWRSSRSARTPVCPRRPPPESRIEEHPRLHEVQRQAGRWYDRGARGRRCSAAPAARGFALGLRGEESGVTAIDQVWNATPPAPETAAPSRSSARRDRSPRPEPRHAPVPRATDRGPHPQVVVPRASSGSRRHWPSGEYAGWRSSPAGGCHTSAGRRELHPPQRVAPPVTRSEATPPRRRRRDGGSTSSKPSCVIARAPRRHGPRRPEQSCWPSYACAANTPEPPVRRERRIVDRDQLGEVQAPQDPGHSRDRAGRSVAPAALRGHRDHPDLEVEAGSGTGGTIRTPRRPAVAAAAARAGANPAAARRASRSKSPPDLEPAVASAGPPCLDRHALAGGQG